MKRKKSSVLVYSDGTTKLYTELLVQVDESGEEWLSPEQVEYLEESYLRAKYRGSDSLWVSSVSLQDFVAPIPVTCNTVYC